MGRTHAALVLLGSFLAIVLLPAMLVAGEIEQDAIIVKVQADGDEDERVVTIEMTGDDTGWLGVGITDLDEKKRQTMELDKDLVVIVTEIYEDSPAEEAGILKGDIVVSVSGNDVTSTKQLVDMIGGMDPYTKLEIELLRDGKKVVKKAVLGVRPHRFVYGEDEDDRIFFNLQGLEELGKLGAMFIPRVNIGMGWGGKGRLGVYVDDLSDGLADYFGISDGKGVLVEEIVEDGPAAAGGIRAGDVIIAVGDRKVSDTDELVEAISDMRADVETPIVIIRKGSEIIIDVTVPESDSDGHITRVKRIEIGDDDVGSGERLIAIEELHRVDEEALQIELEALREAMEELREELEELKKDD